MPKRLKMQKETPVFFLILVFATALYLFNINFSDIWIDEAFTKELIKHPFSEMLELLAGDFHPPLYFLGLKLFTYIVGITDFTIRLFSVIGVLATLIIAFIVGKRVFAGHGALYFCVLVLSLPSLALYAHTARMYTWAAFSVTGVFLYACAFMKTDQKRDLIFLGIFSLAAAYLHYYSLIAAFWANLFVFIYILAQNRKALLAYVLTALAVVLLYLPWLLVFLSQTGSAQEDFWIQAVNLRTVISCYLNPFRIEYWYSFPPSSIALIIMVYLLTLVSVFYIFIFRKANRVTLGLSLFIFNGTILTGVIISFVMRPMLVSRYVTTIVTMLMVPPALYFAGGKNKMLKGILLGLIFCCGVYTSVLGSYVSLGWYRQALTYMKETHPGIKKIIHISEVTTGPFINYSETGQWEHYWLANENTVSYTNIDVFNELHKVGKLDEMLSKGEQFSIVNMPGVPLNQENIDLILSQCRQVHNKEIVDNTFEFYILEYRGDNNAE